MFRRQIHLCDLQFLNRFPPNTYPALWRTYPPNTNYALLTNIHKAPVLDVNFALTSSNLYSASADKILAITDLTTGVRLRRCRGHTGVVNTLDRAIAGGTELIVSGSDDGWVLVWDPEEKEPVAQLEVGSPVTAVAWNGDGTQIFVGGLDNVVNVCAFFQVGDDPANLFSPARCSTCASNKSCILYQVTRTQSLVSLFLPLTTISYQLPSIPPSSSTTSDPSPPVQHAYTGRSTVNRPGTKIPLAGERGVRLVRAGWESAVQIGQ